MIRFIEHDRKNKGRLRDLRSYNLLTLLSDGRPALIGPTAVKASLP